MQLDKTVIRFIILKRKKSSLTTLYKALLTKGLNGMYLAVMQTS